MLFPFKKLVHSSWRVHWAISFVWMPRRDNEYAEALVELNETVQFYQVGDRPRLYKHYCHYNGSNLPTKHSTRGPYLHRGDPVGKGNVEELAATFTRYWKSTQVTTSIDSVTSRSM